MNNIKEEYFQGNEEKYITKKSNSNFLYSFSFLSKEKNEAINTVYAFCRKTDDIADDENKSVEEKYRRILEWRDEFEKALENNESKYSLLNNLSVIIKRFNIPVAPFFDLIKGMEMDLRKNRYNSFIELMDYCFNVASTIGLMCIEIFGYNNPKTKEFAINLGIALQLTNILRDIKADAEQGRIYLPLEDMRRFNYSESDLLQSTYNSEFIKLMQYECERAKHFYNEANKSLTEEDKGLMFAARIMEHIYFRVLKKIERKNYNIFGKKVRVSKLRKIFITAGVYVKYKMLYSFEENKLALNGE